MAGEVDERIDVVEHDPAWGARFAEEAARVRAALGDEVVGVEHFGSTAVAGLAGKPIVDILVGVHDLSRARARTAALVALGYEDFGEIFVPGRVYLRKRGRAPWCNVAVTAIGSPFWEDGLVLRDFLRAHPREAEAYGAHKREVARAAAMFSTYSRAKEPFVAALRERARGWWASAAVRRLVPEDAARCVEVTHSVGWSGDEARWRTMIALGEPFGIDVGDRLAGTVIVNCFGERLAVIAMMIVAPTYQRRGLAARLMTRALAEAGDRRVYLYATPFGRPVYERLGFVTIDAADRYEGRVDEAARRPSVARPACAGDRDAVVALDAEAQGAPRDALLDRLLGEADRAVVVERGGAVAAFGIARVLDGARFLGPIVARKDDDACAVADALVERSPQPIRFDLEPGERALAAWAAGAGLERLGSTPRMVLGRAALPGDRTLPRALAARAFG